MGPKKRPTRNGKISNVRDPVAPKKGKNRANILAQQARIRKHEPIDISIHPSNSFVTLHIASAKLQTLDLPTADRLWNPPDPGWVAQVNTTSALDQGFFVGQSDDQELLPPSISEDLDPTGLSKRAITQVSSKQSTEQAGQVFALHHTIFRKPPTPSLTPVVEEKSCSEKRFSDQNSTVQHRSFSDLNMAPVRDPNNVQGSIKDVVHNLFEVQTQVHGFVPETQPLLIEKMSELAQSLAHLQKITSPTQSPDNPIHQTRIAPEIIDYVDDGRNPDIFTRDFIEVVQRGNAVINGKQQAFRDFAEIFASALKDGIEGVEGEVNKVMKDSQHNSDMGRAQGTRENGLSRS